MKLNHQSPGNVENRQISFATILVHYTIQARRNIWGQWGFFQLSYHKVANSRLHRYAFYQFPFQLIYYCHSKGQIILKGLFGILKFSQKTNKRIRFLENSRIPKVLSKLSDLYIY